MFIISCFFTGFIDEIALENALRLVNGNDNRSGRLEILHNGRWGAICDEKFDKLSAHVACKQLGFFSFEWFHCCSVYGVNEFLWLSNVICTGYESMLANCSHSPWQQHNCFGSETVALRCKLSSCLTGELRCPSNATCQHYELFQGAYCRCPDGSYGRQCEYHGMKKGDLRLVPNIFYPTMKSILGRVEVYANGTWHTICSKGFTEASAKVICHRLGYAGLKQYFVSTNNEYAKGSGSILLSHLQCLGNETSILDCPHRPNVDCEHLNDVGIVCSGTTLVTNCNRCNCTCQFS